MGAILGQASSRSCLILSPRFNCTLFNRVGSLKDPPNATWNVLGLGVSQEETVTTIDGRTLTFGPLSGAAQEIRELVRVSAASNGSAGILPGAIKMNEDFTKGALLAIPETKPAVVHIATHYWYDKGNPQMSFLLLGDGTKLLLQEFKNLPHLFQNVDLLSLSACDTAVAPGSGERDGEEVEGFAYEAEDHGAKSVMASLWKVSDEGTKRLMLRFYEIKRADSQMSKGEALRQAQLELLNGTPHGHPNGQPARGATITGVDSAKLQPYKPNRTAPFSHPYYWAPFILIGNWR
jgi:CHAT domain-containing protein